MKEELKKETEEETFNRIYNTLDYGDKVGAEAYFLLCETYLKERVKLMATTEEEINLLAINKYGSYADQSTMMCKSAYKQGIEDALKLLTEK